MRNPHTDQAKNMLGRSHGLRNPRSMLNINMIRMKIIRILMGTWLVKKRFMISINPEPKGASQTMKGPKDNSKPKTKQAPMRPT